MVATLAGRQPDKPAPPSEEQVLLAQAAGVPVEHITDDKPIQPKPSATSKMIDIAQVQGQVHAQSVQKVGELADKNPHEAVSIIRNWLHEDAA